MAGFSYRGDVLAYISLAALEVSRILTTAWEDCWAAARAEKATRRVVEKCILYGVIRW